MLSKIFSGISADLFRKLDFRSFAVDGTARLLTGRRACVEFEGLSSPRTHAAARRRRSTRGNTAPGLQQQQLQPVTEALGPLLVSDDRREVQQLRPHAGPLPAHAITELQRPDRSTTEGSLPDRPRAAARGRPAWPGAPWPGIPSVPGLSDDLARSCRGERGICRPEHEEPLLPQRVQLAPYILAEAALHRACERPDG